MTIIVSKTSILVAFLLSFSWGPSYTLASGPFSFLAALIAEGDQTFAQEITSKNIWTMNLLETVPNPNPKLAIGGGDITIIDDSALVAETGALGTIADIEGSRHPSSISIYIVKEGDTLSQIAEMYGVSVNTIKWANNTSSAIKPGQMLVILPVSGTKHTVAKGDTLASVAKKYKADAEEIAKFNGIKGTTLAVGETIIIPDGEVTVAAPSYASSKGNLPVYSGYYMRPIVGGAKSQGIHGYNGVDLANTYGTRVVAAAAGTVIVAKDWGWNGGYGNYVVISHTNGTQTLYSHLKDVLVAQGETVKQGEVIGSIGMTGKTTGPHLHFEIRGARNPF